VQSLLAGGRLLQLHGEVLLLRTRRVLGWLLHRRDNDKVLLRHRDRGRWLLPLRADDLLLRCEAHGRLMWPRRALGRLLHRRISGRELR
jgi:hypothetical protein